MAGWIAFFLKAITIQARLNSDRGKAIMQLYDEMKVLIHEVTHSQYSVYLLDALFNNPTFRTSDVANKLKQENKIHEKTTRDLLKQLKDAGALYEIQSSRGSRSAVFCFPELINLAEGKEVFKIN